MGTDGEDAPPQVGMDADGDGKVTVAEAIADMSRRSVQVLPAGGWDKVRRAAKVQSATKQWWRPTYWSEVTDTKLSAAMPLDKMFCVLLFRFPYYTLGYCIACILMYYEGDRASQDGLAYQHTATFTTPWYTPVAATILHVNENHLLLNMCLLGVGGGLLEFSEGHAFMAAIHIGSGPLGFGFHGIESDMRVRGASGVIYAIMFAQVALLIMNWRELRCERWLRLLVLVGLTSMEVVMYVTNPNHAVLLPVMTKTIL